MLRDGANPDYPEGVTVLIERIETSFATAENVADTRNMPILGNAHNAKSKEADTVLIAEESFMMLKHILEAARLSTAGPRWLGPRSHPSLAAS